MTILSLIGGDASAEPYIDQPAGLNQFHSGMASASELAGSHEAATDTREVIVGLALDALNESHDRESYRFSVTPRWIPGSLERLDSDKIRSVLPDGSVERYTNFTVTYRDRGRTETANVQLLVETERYLPVASERIMSGEKINGSSLDLRWVPVPYDRGQLVESIDEVQGKTVRRTLSDGQPIRYADISSSFLVEAGETVEMIYEQNGLRIVIEGEARQSGAQDDEITIYNKETRKRYAGKVSGPGVVLWIKTL